MGPIVALRLSSMCLLLLAGCQRTQVLDIGEDVSPPATGGLAGGGRGAGLGAGGGGAAGGGGSPMVGEPDAGPPAPTCTAPGADCDGLPGNGCEVDLRTDPKHCGACGVGCTFDDCACEGGQRVLACPVGRADCDGAFDNGCEVDTGDDAAHCGTCGETCPAFGIEFHSSSCVNGACVPDCESGHFDCDGALSTGCESRSPCP